MPLIHIISFGMSVIFSLTLFAEEIGPASPEIKGASIELAPQVQIPVKLINKPNPAIEGGRVYLRNILECDGLTGICAEVEGVDLGKAPEPGQTTSIVVNDVLNILKEEFPNCIFIHNGDERIALKSEFIVIDSDLVRAQLQAYFDRLLSTDSNLRAKVTSLRLNRELRVRPGKFQLRFPDIYFNGRIDLQRLFRDYIGNTLIEVVYVPEANPTMSYRFRAQSRVLIERYTPVAIKVLAKGKVLHVNDFHFQWLRLKRNHARYLQKIEPYEGWTLTQPIDAGEAVSVRKISKPNMVARGDVVDVEIARGRMRLSTKAKALQAGAKGDFINVQYVNTRKELRATVLGKNRVEVKL